MKLDLHTFNLGEKEKIEVSFEQVFVVMKDLAINLMKAGQLDISAVSPDSLEFQIQASLKEFKAAGSKRENLQATVIAVEGGPTEIGKIVGEIERFGIELKFKSISAGDQKTIQINKETGDLFISKNKSLVYKNTELLAEAVIEVKKTRVLIVEDSKPMQTILRKIFSDIPHVEIVGVESTPAGAAQKLQEAKPDFITLDMHLEDGNGCDFLKKSKFKEYAKAQGARCVLVTDCSLVEGNIVFDALANGASSYIQKPQVSNLKQLTDELAELINEMFVAKDLKSSSSRAQVIEKNIDVNDFKLVAIGSSTGGTELVREIIGGLPKKCPPIVVVQHMPSQFTGLYAERIQSQTGRITQEVTHLTQLLPNHAYIAAGGTHLVIEKINDQLYAKPKVGEMVNRFMPSVSVLFGSIEKASLSRRTIAIILTGMGSDGAKEMRSLKEAGAFTIGQSKESCVVYGMPRAAEELGALCWSASPEQIIYRLSHRSFSKSS